MVERVYGRLSTELLAIAWQSRPARSTYTPVSQTAAKRLH
jgi:hypothetical protein